MARPYAIEMAQLVETFEWATSTNVDALCRAVGSAGLSPLRAIGSGGSLTAAHALTALHQQHTGNIAAVATPLEAVEEPLDENVVHWLISAGGRNVDILAAAKALIFREPRQLAVLCGRDDSPVAKLCKAHPFVDLLPFPSPAGKDGFLATNSLLGFTTLLARAYASEFGDDVEWRATLELVRAGIAELSSLSAGWEAEASRIWARPTTLVLFSPSTRIGAIDLESKFTEAALGNLQLADYRNFAHGRHHWLAKRGELSAVLAFITDSDRALAERTLALIPEDVPQARIELPGIGSTAALMSLVAALRITGWAGTVRGIDPGQPGVPSFGRKLYNLSLPRPVDKAGPQISACDAAAIKRKTGSSPQRLAAAGELKRWQLSLDAMRDRLLATRFVGLVLDYDGTVVDTRDRFSPPLTVIQDELVRVLEAGVWVAFATGRGASIRRDLQGFLPSSLWRKVMIGYYNGAEVSGLDDDGAPDGSNEAGDDLKVIANALRAQPELVHAAKQTDRPRQITLEGARVLPEARLWDLAQQVILAAKAHHLRVTRSSHSIDIVPEDVSKLNVVSRLRDEIGKGALLTIGDRGRWPGNDHALLSEPFSLSVDEVSVDPETCWNLAPPGQRGPAATLHYLSALEASGGELRFRPGSLQ